MQFLANLKWVPWRQVAVVTLAAALVLSDGVAHAHPFHVSIAEAELNGKTDRLEWSVRVHPVDLENALRRLSHRPVDLDKTPDIDHWIKTYIEHNIRVIRPDQQPAKLTLVGKEISTKYVWLYFEFAGPLSPGQWKIRQSMFFELLKDQTNTVTLKQGKLRTSLECTRTDPMRTVEFPLRRK